MCSNYIVDAKFALLLIQSLKEMLKTNGLPFIRNGVTLPFLAYAYKRLNCDDSPITEEYIRKIINSLDSAKDIKFGIREVNCKIFNFCKSTYNIQ